MEMLRPSTIKIGVLGVVGGTQDMRVKHTGYRKEVIFCHRICKDVGQRWDQEDKRLTSDEQPAAALDEMLDDAFWLELLEFCALLAGSPLPVVGSRKPIPLLWLVCSEMPVKFAGTGATPESRERERVTGGRHFG